MGLYNPLQVASSLLWKKLLWNANASVEHQRFTHGCLSQTFRKASVCNVVLSLPQALEVETE